MKGRGHSALRLKSAILHSDFRLRTSSARPQSSLESPDLSSQILECQTESSPKDSESISESTLSVIASEAKQSIKTDSESVDCHADKSARNDSKTESCPLQNLESAQDSELTSAERHALSAIESSFSSKRCAEQALKASSGVSGISANGLQGGRERLRNSSPSPLDEKEKEILKNDRILEVKALDSERLDSESDNQAESATVRDSKKRGLEIMDCHEAIASRNDGTRTATDSESAPSVIASEAKQSIKQNSESMDCHADRSARNDDRLDSKSIDCRDSACAKSRNDNKTESTPRPSLESQTDSESIVCHAELAPARNDKNLESATRKRARDACNLNNFGGALCLVS